MLPLLLLALTWKCAFSEEHWGYENNEGELDPSHWYIKYKTCIGNRQSPIDIEIPDVVLDYSLKPIQFHGYNTVLLRVNLTNDGHTVRADIPDNAALYISSDSFNTSYKLKQFHFHWGHNDTTGSEHVVFRKRYPLEMHLVHVDERVSLDDALQEPYGLVVISVFFKIGTRSSEEMSKLTGLFSQIADPRISNVTTIQRLKVCDLLPRHMKNYLMYAGSLTTPPCNEAVKWIISTRTASVTHDEMTEFRTLKHFARNGEEPLETNDRNLQGIKDREVYLYNVNKMYAFDDLF